MVESVYWAVRTDSLYKATGIESTYYKGFFWEESMKTKVNINMVFYNHL
jgi:hypothetical protein